MTKAYQIIYTEPEEEIYLPIWMNALKRTGQQGKIPCRPVFPVDFPHKEWYNIICK